MPTYPAPGPFFVYGLITRDRRRKIRYVGCSRNPKGREYAGCATSWTRSGKRRREIVLLAIAYDLDDAKFLEWYFASKIPDLVNCKPNKVYMYNEAHPKDYGIQFFPAR